ncbi:MAG: MFS transporter [Chloroflexia bacterium]
MPPDGATVDEDGMTPLHSGRFRLLWCSSLASAGAQGMERTTTAWLALLAAHNPLGVGIVFAARNLPSLLFGLMSGTIADRVERPRLLLGVAGVAAVLMALLSWLSSGGNIQTWQVAAIAFATGCFQVFDTPARQALVMDTVPRALATSAVALNAFATRLAMAIGAFAAGLLIPAVGVSRCYLVVAGVYVASGTLMSTLHVARGTRTAASHPPFREALGDAARLIVQVPAVRTLMIAGIACEVFAFSHGSALPTVAQSVLRAGASGLGTLNSAVAIGGTTAVLLLSLIPGRVRREPLLGAAFVVYGLSLLGVSSARNLATAAAILVVTGLCAGAFDVLQQTLIQLAVPEEQRGRAVGIWVLGLGSAPVGNLEMGTLIATFGAPVALLINGCLTLASAAVLLVRAPQYRLALRTRGETA